MILAVINNKDGTGKSKKGSRVRLLAGESMKGIADIRG